MRVLITGATGFAGSHLARACAAAGEEVVAVARPRAVPGACEHPLPVGTARIETDLLDAEATRAVVRDARPDVVHHLAALASVPASWSEPGRTLTENVATSANLLEAVREAVPEARVVVVGSGEIYGPPERLPVEESAPLRPQNPYAVSKAAVDLMAGFYADVHGLAVVRVRAFNHAGPGQAPIYAAASFARQVALGRLEGARPIRVVTGNPDSRRDFTDVRDVVRAYRLLAQPGVEPGAYNVCSGRSVSGTEILALLAQVTGEEIDHVVDSARVRAHDVPDVHGSYARLATATGWEPEIPLTQTLADAVEAWSVELAAAR